MSAKTGISWTDSTFNPWMGCTKVSPACDHCYAERDTRRFGRVEWGTGMPRVRTSASNWRLPERWNRQRFMECGACGWRGDCAAELIGCGACGSIEQMNDARRRVFCASLADWLDNEVPIEWLVDLLDLIRRTPNLDWLLLTKRIGNWYGRLSAATVPLSIDDSVGAMLTRQMVEAWLGGKPPSNVWLGSTVINQAEADRDIPKLLAVPARIRFVSIEPMLGLISLKRLRVAGHGWYDALEGWRECTDWGGRENLIDWIICGGESGPHARPMDPEWVRSLRDQCTAAGIPFHFKQWGEWAPRDPYGSEQMESDELARKWTGTCYRFGKTAAGRLLDGVEHNGFPP